MSRLRVRIEFKGTRLTIASIVLADGVNPAAVFLDGLSEADRRKLDTLFERMGDHGKIMNREKFKKLDKTDGLFAFKSFQIRVPCFFGKKGQMLYLLFGLIKKTDDFKDSEVKRAEDYRKWAREQLGE